MALASLNEQLFQAQGIQTLPQPSEEIPHPLEGTKFEKCLKNLH